MFLALGVGRMVCGHLPLHDARLLQGPAVPLGRASSSSASARNTISSGWAGCGSVCRSPSGPSSSAASRSRRCRSLTRGFYSKDLILWEAWSDGAFGPWLSAAGLFGALLTAIYIFRAVFVVFFGPVKLEPTGPTGWRIAVPLVVLSILALIGGFVEIPPYLGNVPAFSRLIQSALPAPPAAVYAGSSLRLVLSAIAAVVAVLGVGIAYIAFRRRPAFPGGCVQSPQPRPATLLGNRMGIRLAVRSDFGTAISLGWPRTISAISSTALHRPAHAEPSGLPATQRIRDRSCAPVRGRNHGWSIVLIAILVFRLSCSGSFSRRSSAGYSRGSPGAATILCRAGYRSAVWRSISCGLALWLTHDSAAVAANGTWLARIDWPWIPQRH